MTKADVMDLRTVSFYLGKDMRDWLSEVAAEQDRPVSRIVREALQLYRDRLQPKGETVRNWDDGQVHEFDAVTGAESVY